MFNMLFRQAQVVVFDLRMVATQEV
jgi:hypothetical protein